MKPAIRQPIVIVEDSDDDFEATERALKRNGGLANPLLRFDCAESTLLYLSKVMHGSDDPELAVPGIILLDLNLPGIGGAAILSQMRSQLHLAEIPVVVLTTSTDPRDIERCYKAGANTYIQKPVDLERFFKAIQQLKDYWFELAILPGQGKCARRQL